MFTEFVMLKKYPGYFIAHSPARLGRIRNGLFCECSQTPNSKQDAYWSVTVKTPKGKYVKRSMHRLLMETFVPNPENKAHVNHIDGDKSNNELSNLEWATPRENSQHAIDTGLKGKNYRIKPVYQYNLAGDFIAGYPDDSTAEKITGILKQNISKCTLLKRIHAGYFQWRRVKHTKIPAVKRQYIKGYYYKDTMYPTIKAIAIKLNAPYPEHQVLKQVQKFTPIPIKVIYYE